MSSLPSFKARKVLVTGHTGFTGAWAVTWLQRMGAEVYGVALPPDSDPNLFEALGSDQTSPGELIDIRNYGAVLQIFRNVAPEIVLHLAAQPLVRKAYRDPLETFETNVIGTANVLEAARQTPNTKAVVCVTTDKVYENREWTWAYRENDSLGGRDPYSASKACAELVTHSYQSTLNALGSGVAVATARGGNIIGGGDWAEDRIVPDLVRSIIHNEPLELRSPNATRPWQHVLCLIHGYLLLADHLCRDAETGSGAWNFGPPEDDRVEVINLIKAVGRHWREPALKVEPSPLPESGLLALDSSKAKSELGWRPAWDFETVCKQTATWYRDYHEGDVDAATLCGSQIEAYWAALG